MADELPPNPTTDQPVAPVEAAEAPLAQPEPEVAKPTAFVPPKLEESKPFIVTIRSWIRDYFFGEEPLSLSTALVPLCFFSMLLYTRNPIKTNFIFDEQEALLANPYVRSVADPASKLHWLDAFRRDFWGLPADRTIGSYRPLPDLVWRALWGLGAREQTPFLHHWVNVLLHGLNGALVTMIVLRVTKDRVNAWLAGAVFVGAAVVTEAVSGVVGLADVLGALGALLALVALVLPLWAMPFAVFVATLFGLYSKESALCIVPMVPFAALVMAHVTHPKRPLRWARGVAALVAVATAFVLYVELRRKMFPAALPSDLTIEANADKPWAARTYATLLRWYAQPILPKDPLNNPLVDATPALRVAGGLRVYARGLWQIIFPWTLSGDYSAPQEPIPSRLVFPESIIGALMMVGPAIASIWLAITAWRKHRAAKDAMLSDNEAAPGAVHGAIAVALLWILVSYFPVSNIPILLPTVRAERFWYFPALGTSLIISLALTRGWVEAVRRNKKWVGIAGIALFLLIQSIGARKHANDYADDLVFWDATRRAVPRSAKAHLNYSVMQGARGNMEERLNANRVALELAPKWPMASIYLGDTLCRMHRAEEAWPHYVRGFELGPNDLNLIALALQCVWDEKIFDKHKDELEAMGAQHLGSWLEYLERDMVVNGETHQGIDPKYRPRGYNEGPKGD